MTNRLGYLDSLRGIAALLVLVYHFFVDFSFDETTYIVLQSIFINFIDLGKIGVVVFFILSGFVIPYSIKDYSKETIFKFILARFFRLYPVYWISVILGAILFEKPILVTVVNFTMLQQFFGVQNVLGLYWTLQIELIFYFFVVILIYVRKLKNIKVLFFLSVFFLIIASILSYFRMVFMIKLPLALLLALSLMFFGSYFRVYALREKKMELAKTYFVRYSIVFFVLIPIISRLGYDIDFGHNENWLKYVISYYSSYIIFIICALFRYTYNLLEFLGKISYSLYLFHPLVLYVLTPVCIGYGFSSYTTLFVNIVVVVLLSYGLYYFVEKRMVLFGKNFLKKVL